MGSGTTARGASVLNRNFIGSEINEEYVKIIEERLTLPYIDKTNNTNEEIE